MSYIESYVSDDEEDYVETQGYDRRAPPPPPPRPVMSGAMGDKSAVGGSVYAMSAGPTIITELRNVGVNVLSIESNADILSYLDAVATESLSGQQCLLYTDSNGRTFNVVVSVSWCRVSKSCIKYLSCFFNRNILTHINIAFLLSRSPGRSRRSHCNVQFGQGNIFWPCGDDLPTLCRPSDGIHGQSFLLRGLRSNSSPISRSSSWIFVLHLWYHFGIGDFTVLAGHVPRCPGMQFHWSPCVAFQHVG